MQIQYLVLFCLFVTAMEGKLPQVVVVSVGAIRLDVLLKQMPEVKFYFENSARPEYLMPVMPTKGPVNHMSIATGLYPEDHGVINDCEYDEVKITSSNDANDDANKLKDCIKPDQSRTPVWIENREAGGISGVIGWPGAEKLFNGKQSNYYLRTFYDDPQLTYIEDQIDSRIDKIVEWLTLKSNPVNLMMVYYGYLDKILHEDSIDSMNVYYKLKNMEYFITNLISRLKRNVPDVNLIVLGSHGGKTVEENVKDNMIFIIKILTNTKYKTIESWGANAVVTPGKGELENVYKILQNAAVEKKQFRVYYQNEILDIWHLKKMTFFNDKIFLVANKNYFFFNEYLRQVQEKTYKSNTKFEPTIFGYWDEAEEDREYQKTFFMAMGPNFVSPKEVPSFSTIDVYPLIRKLLELPEKENAKLSEAVNQLLKPEKSDNVAETRFLMEKSEKKEPGIIAKDELLKVKDKKKGSGFFNRINKGAEIFTQSVKGSYSKRNPKV